MKTFDARSLSSVAQEDLRRKAVKAVLDGTEVAKLFGITRQAIGKWMKAYREGGVKKLKAKRKGRPKGGFLLPWQADQIVKAIVGRNPDQLRLPFCIFPRGGQTAHHFTCETREHSVPHRV